MSEITHGSLFSGVGGFDLGFDEAGMRTIWQSEYDPTPISELNPNARPLAEQWNHRVLSRHWPDVPNVGDVQNARNLAAADVISFGSPCQDLSVAGRRAGLEGEKSGLFFEAARVIDECRPVIAIWENVPGAFSSNAGRDFAAVVDAMVKLGARDVAWRVIDSQYSGVPQRRRRIFLVADFRGERAGAILYDANRCGGHYPAGEEARENAAARAPRGAFGALASTLGGRGARSHTELDGSGGFVISDSSIAETITAASSRGAVNKPGRRREDDYNLVPGPLRARDSKGLGFEAVDSLAVVPDPVYVIQERAVSDNDAAGPQGSGIGEGVAFTLEARTRTQMIAIGGDVTHALTSEGADASEDGTGRGTPLAFESRVARNGRGAPDTVVPPLKAQSAADGRGDGAPLVFDRVQVTSRENRSRPQRGDPAHSLASEPPTMARYGTVRRFTPTECERLQGFPDGWTCLCGSSGDMFACKCSDGPRYRALGNAVSATVAYWLGLRIVEVLS